MTIYASKTPRDLNHDPNPYATPSGYRTNDRPGSYSWDKFPAHMKTYNPRPEFDHAQHNEPNPILVELRVAADVDFTWATARMLDALTYDHRAPEAMREVVRHSLPEARDHARRVLERLANLSQIGA